MDKHFLFISSAPLKDNKNFMVSLSEFGVDLLGLEFFSETSGEWIAPAESFAEVETLISLLHDDLGCSISVLAAHQHTAFEDKLLKEAFAYFPNMALFPSDVLMKEMSFGDYSSYGALIKLFKGINYDLMLTASTYLRCGLDACLAAKKLFIHRNTFNYRLNAFIAATGLDIRDYHNALLLELYLQLSNGRMA
ncbi:MAG: PucR family transcriptional regulator [Erysipelotrichaceae bacterium]|jgi:hypothetical protein|nr:PucR family transcriptional regulator [Erysipelotrichaceae bacterium]